MVAGTQREEAQLGERKEKGRETDKGTFRPIAGQRGWALRKPLLPFSPLPSSQTWALFRYQMSGRNVFSLELREKGRGAASGLGEDRQRECACLLAGGCAHRRARRLG